MCDDGEVEMVSIALLQVHWLAIHTLSSLFPFEIVSSSFSQFVGLALSQTW